MIGRLLILTLALYSCTAALTTDLVVPENLDFTAFSKLAPTDFLQAVIKSGGTEADCRSFATTTISTISESVKSQEKILDAVDTGAGCAAEGQELVQVAQGKLQGKQGVLATKEGLAKAAREAKTAACTAAVDMSVGLDTLTKASCYDYTTEASFISTDAACTGATTASNQAAAAVVSAQTGVDDAQGEVDDAVAEAARLKSGCLCRVHQEQAAAQVAVQAATATNAADWKQAHEVLCAVKQTTTCPVPSCPTVTQPTLADGVANADTQHCRSTCGEVIQATGGGVTWLSPVVTTQGMLTNPGTSDYTFAYIPSELIGGKYVGSPGARPGGKYAWPHGSGWVWTITVDAPAKVYVWIQDSHTAGIDSAPAGWTTADAASPSRSDNQNGKLYSKWVSSSTSLSSLSSTLVGGAFTKPCSSIVPQAPADPTVPNNGVAVASCDVTAESGWTYVFQLVDDRSKQDMPAVSERSSAFSNDNAAFIGNGALDALDLSTATVEMCAGHTDHTKGQCTIECSPLVDADCMAGNVNECIKCLVGQPCAGEFWNAQEHSRYLARDDKAIKWACNGCKGHKIAEQGKGWHTWGFGLTMRSETQQEFGAYSCIRSAKCNSETLGQADAQGQTDENVLQIRYRN